jgi:integrase
MPTVTRSRCASGSNASRGRRSGSPSARRSELQKLIDRRRSSAPRSERVDIATAGERYLVHLADVMKRKPSTVQDYRIMLRKHLGPFFGGRSLDRIDTQLVADDEEGLDARQPGRGH